MKCPLKWTAASRERVALHRGEPPQADYSVQGVWRKIKALLLCNNSALLFSADKNKPLPIFLVSACFHNIKKEVSTKVDSGEPPQADYSVQEAWRKIRALLLRNNLALLVSADKNKPLPIFLVKACLLTFINEVSTKVDSGEPPLPVIP